MRRTTPAVKDCEADCEADWALWRRRPPGCRFAHLPMASQVTPRRLDWNPLLNPALDRIGVRVRVRAGVGVGFGFGVGFKVRVSEFVGVAIGALQV